MSKRVLIPIADGVEDIETVTQIDVLRRAKADVVVASVEDRLEIVAARGTRIVADRLFADCGHEDFDLISLPGGLPGAERLRDHAGLVERLRRQRDTGKYYGAICASPAYVLQTHGLLEGREATCYPAFRSQLAFPATPDRAVVVAERCITSQGPGTAMAYSLTLVERLFGRAVRHQIAEAMLVPE